VIVRLNSQNSLNESPFLRNAQMYDWNLFRRNSDWDLYRGDKGNLLATITQNTTLQSAQIEDGTVCELHAEIKRHYGSIMTSPGNL